MQLVVEVDIVSIIPLDMLLTAHQAFYSVGYVLLSLFAYFVRDWRFLTIMVSLPIVFCSVFIIQHGLCESPQWLVENGKTKESKHLLKEIAKINGADISETLLERLSIDQPTKLSSTNQDSTSVFAQPEYLKKVLTLSFIWLFLSMMYYGLSFISGSLNSNKYISFSLSGLVEIPALLLSMWVMKPGKKIPLFVLALFGAFSCLVCAWLQGGNPLQTGFLITILALLGKFGVTASYNINFIFSVENFDVSVRSFSMALFSTSSSIGGILAPLVIGLGSYDQRIPMVTFGMGAIIASGLVMTLHDTVRIDKPEKLQ